MGCQAFTVASLAFMTLFVNSIIMLFRARVNPATHAPPSHYPLPPAMSYPGAHGYLPIPQEWNEKPWKRIQENEEVPTRRRRLEDGQAAKVK